MLAVEINTTSGVIAEIINDSPDNTGRLKKMRTVPANANTAPAMTAILIKTGIPIRALVVPVSTRNPLAINKSKPLVTYFVSLNTNCAYGRKNMTTEPTPNTIVMMRLIKFTFSNFFEP